MISQARMNILFFIKSEDFLCSLSGLVDFPIMLTMEPRMLEHILA